jgi:hypothetical protein
VASLLAQRPDSNDDTVREAAPASHLDTNASDPSPPPVVQRIPRTCLSFFPPPSSSSSSSRPGTPPPGTAIDSTFATSRLHSRSRSRATLSISTPPPPSRNIRSTALSSFFSILPLNASTRDEIMSRLSVDSNSNSTTGTASDEDEHELTAVRTTPKLRADASAAASPSPSSAPLAAGPRRRKSPARGWVSRSRSGDLNGYGGSYSGDTEEIPLASSPIHTTQMQPAPTMQLPESIMTRSPDPSE